MSINGQVARVGILGKTQGPGWRTDAGGEADGCGRGRSNPGVQPNRVGSAKTGLWLTWLLEGPQSFEHNHQKGGHRLNSPCHAKSWAQCFWKVLPKSQLTSGGHPRPPSQRVHEPVHSPPYSSLASPPSTLRLWGLVQWELNSLQESWGYRHTSLHPIQLGQGLWALLIVISLIKRSPWAWTGWKQLFGVSWAVPSSDMQAGALRQEHYVNKQSSYDGQIRDDKAETRVL